MLELLLAVAFAKEPTPIKWESDLDKALALAAKTKKHVFLDYYTNWCPPCQEMDKDLLRSGALGPYQAEFVFVHLDGDRLPAKTTYKRYPILGYPTVWIIGPDGKAKGRFIGYEKKQDFLEFVSDTLDGKDQDARLAQKLEKNPDDPWTLVEAFGAALIKDDAKQAAGLKARLKAGRATAKPEQKQDWDAAYERSLLDECSAAQYAEQPDYGAVVRLSSAALAEVPNSPFAPGFAHMQAKALRGLGREAEADAVMGKLTDRFPKESSAYWRVLEYARLNGTLSDVADKALETGLILFPKNERFLNQAHMYVKAKDPKRAKEFAKTLKSLKPDNHYYDEL